MRVRLRRELDKLGADWACGVIDYDETQKRVQATSCAQTRGAFEIVHSSRLYSPMVGRSGGAAGRFSRKRLDRQPGFIK